MGPNKDTVGLHTFMQNRRTLFCYSGPMTEDLLTTIANPVRHQLSDKETEEAVANRVFGVFIEQAQNIIRYSHQKTKSTGDSVGTIAISLDDDCFLIEAVNVVSESKRDVLEATLVDLSVKDQQELRKLYRQRLKDGPPEDSAGAGLGFIDRRRDGLTRRLTTTRRFAEYFGCPEVEYQKVREWFRAEAGKAGLTSAQLAASLSDEQMTIEEFSEAPSEEALAMEAAQGNE